MLLSEDGSIIMSESVTTTIRLDKEIKEEATQIFRELGLSLSGGIEVCLRAIVREQGIPFDLRLGKKEG
jgi:DNA-damage-inducible protein J